MFVPTVYFVPICSVQTLILSVLFGFPARRIPDHKSARNRTRKHLRKLPSVMPPCFHWRRESKCVVTPSGFSDMFLFPVRNRVKRVKLRTLVSPPPHTPARHFPGKSNTPTGESSVWEEAPFLGGGGINWVFAKAVEEGLNLAHGGQMPIFTTFE